MSIEQTLHFKRQEAQLQRMAEHWQTLVTHGDPHTGWQGDHNLVMYHEVLTDEITIKYEVPNRPSQLVMRGPIEGFDPHKATAALNRADHRRHSPDEIIARVDKSNEQLERDVERANEDKRAESAERLKWAVKRDNGGIAPVLMPGIKGKAGSQA